MSGRVIAGRYRLDEPIGRGAMGVVWRARDELLDRDVAVKEVLISEALSDEERDNAYQRTLREARTAARLSHRGVVAVYDVAEDDGRPWIVMELVPSKSLEQILTESGPISPRRAGRMAQQLLAALATAHAAGVLHRDVKPSNVLLAAEGRAVLTDFGIATFQGDPRLTQTGMVMGSPGYTAPERIRGGPATPASDLWSLGATLYTAVEGHGPFEKRGGAITTMSAIIHEDPPPCSAAGPLAGIILALLRRDPARRPDAQTAARLIVNLLPALPDERVTDTVTPAAMTSPPADVSVASAAPSEAPPATAPNGARAGGAAARLSGLAGAVSGAARGLSNSVSGLASGTAAPVREDPAPSEDPAAVDGSAAPESEAADSPAHSDPPTKPQASPLFSPRAGGPPPSTWAQQQPAETDAQNGAVPATRRKRWGTTLVATAIVLAVVIGTTVAFTLHHNTTTPPHTTSQQAPPNPPNGALAALESGPTAPPAGYSPVSVKPSAAGTAAGFSIGVPPGWFAKNSGLVWWLYGPDKTSFMRIELTSHTFPDMFAEASYISKHDLQQGTLPDYQQIMLRRAVIRGTRGAIWEFSWLNDGVRIQGEDLLFDKDGQSYALYLVAQQAAWPKVLPMFEQELTTFQVITTG